MKKANKERKKTGHLKQAERGTFALCERFLPVASFSAGRVKRYSVAARRKSAPGNCAVFPRAK
jgi:hypothetical protein